MPAFDLKRAVASASLTAVLLAGLLVAAAPSAAQDRPAFGGDRYAEPPYSSEPYRGPESYPRSDAYRPAPPAATAPPYGGYDAGRGPDTYRPPAGRGDAYVPPPRDPAWGSPGGGPGASRGYAGEGYRPDRSTGYPGPGPGPYGGEAGGYGRPYAPPPEDDGPPGDPSYAPPPSPGYGPPPGRYAEPPPRYDDRRGDGTYSRNEVLDTGHRFFGSISRGLANAVEWAFQQAGRPNGYVLGEDAGGAFIAGLRYGEGVLYTKDAGNHRVYWQGPSLGYDFGGEGSKTMVLVYNLRDPGDIYARFGGIQGAAYLVGGVSVQFQSHDDVKLAVIRSGVGLRLGANVGYLKYTRTPTWNPF